jgi:hypothetical protein
MRLIALCLLALLTAGCAAPEQVYFTKPGEWDPSVLAKDQEECETLATNSAPYRRAFNNPFMAIFAREILVDETRDCLINLHGWRSSETAHPRP